MALNLWKSTCRYNRHFVLAFLRRYSCEKATQLAAINTIDALDEFTAKLSQKKALKWGTIKYNQQRNPSSCILKSANPDELKEQPFNKLSIQQLDQQLLSLTCEESIDNFFKCCVQHNRCPSFSSAVIFLDSRAQSLNVILQLKHLLAKHHQEFYQNNGSMNHYLAESYWINGEIVKAVELLESVYSKCIYLRRRLKLMLQYLVHDITKQSEAALMTVLKFAEELNAKHKEPFLLVAIWQTCFLSEWYSDQKLSVELLERNKFLCDELDNLIPLVVTKALRQHQVDVVYRLLEVLLKYSLKKHYTYVLISIFNYKFIMGDLKSCLEVIQWSEQNDAQLPPEIDRNFLLLFLNKNKKAINIKTLTATKKATVKLKF